MKKALQLKPTAIDIYSGHAGIVSIVSNNDEWIPWIYMRFIRIAFDIRYQYMDFFDSYYQNHYARKTATLSNGHEYSYEYRNYPFLVEEDVTQDACDNDLCEYLMDCIDSGFYINLYLNHYYIKRTSAYGKFHMLHDYTLISGYDSDRKVFLASDNFTNGKYMLLEIPFSEIRQARASAMDYSMDKHKFDSKAAVLRSSFTHTEKFNFDLQYVIYALQDYLHGTDSFYDRNCKEQEAKGYVMDNNKGYIFGIQNFDLIQKYLKEVENGASYVDHRPFHLMYNHKTVIKQLVRYLGKNKLAEGSEVLCKEFETLEQYCLDARNLCMKYYMSKKEPILYKIIDLYERIKIKDTLAFEKLLHHIKS